MVIWQSRSLFEGPAANEHWRPRSSNCINAVNVCPLCSVALLWLPFSDRFAPLLAIIRVLSVSSCSFLRAAFQLLNELWLLLCFVYLNWVPNAMNFSIYPQQHQRQHIAGWQFNNLRWFSSVSLRRLLKNAGSKFEMDSSAKVTACGAFKHTHICFLCS